MFKKKQPPPSDFQSRVQAYEAARKKGMVFQAEGTVGGILLKKRRSTRSGARFFALILVVALLFAMKAGLLSYVGPDIYRTRLTPFAASDAPHDQVIAYVMHIDPITLWLAKAFNDLTFQVQNLAGRYMPEPLQK